MRFTVPPANLHDKRLRDRATVAGGDGHFFDVIRNGWNNANMPGYAHALSEKDTWAIVLYVRALQEATVGQVQPNDLNPPAAPAPGRAAGRIDPGGREAMSHAAAAHPGDHAHGPDGHGHGQADTRTLLAESNVNAPGFRSGLSILLMVLGLAGIAGAGVMWYSGDETARLTSFFSYHAGAMITLGLCLGPLGVVMMFHLVGAGWSITLRRQFENAGTLIWLPIFLLIPTVLLGGSDLFHWMHDAHATVHDPVILKKSAYLNPVFFYARFAVYFIIWGYLAYRMFSLSRQQDLTGDKWLSNKAKVHLRMGHARLRALGGVRGL